MVGGPLVLALVVLMNRHHLAQKKYEKIEKALESGRSPEEVERMMKIMDTIFQIRVCSPDDMEPASRVSINLPDRSLTDSSVSADSGRL